MFRRFCLCPFAKVSNLETRQSQRRAFTNEMDSIRQPRVDFVILRGVDGKQYHEPEDGVLLKLSQSTRAGLCFQKSFDQSRGVVEKVDVSQEGECRSERKSRKCITIFQFESVFRVLFRLQSLNSTKQANQLLNHHDITIEPISF